MLSFDELGPAMRGALRRLLLDPADAELRSDVLREAIIDLAPPDVMRLASWQHCTAPTQGNNQLRLQIQRIRDGRSYRRSVLPSPKAFRKVDFGDGLELLFAADLPAAVPFMRRVMPATGVHEPELVAYLRRSLRPGDLVVDLGAHVGYVACVAAALGATVLAVEMQSTLIPVIQVNAAVNDLWRVHPLCAAVSDHSGLMPSMRLNPTPGLRAEIGQWEAGRYPLTGVNHDLVAVLTLDGMFPRPPFPALVKVDVEGAEARVLVGARSLIAAARTVFMVEVHVQQLPKFDSRLDDVLAAFPEGAWRLSLLTPEGAVPLGRDAFLDPEGPVARHHHNAPVLFEPAAG